jgi:hypothetical protein
VTTFYHLTLKSGNEKTGPIPVSTSSANTCPDACPLKAGGCYAKGWPLVRHWAKVSDGAAGGTLDTFVGEVEALPAGQLWRHNQAGDLPGEDDAIDGSALLKIVRANVGKRGFTYTHKPMTRDNARHVAHANRHGFMINLSADNLAEADELAALAIAPVVAILPSDTTAAHVLTPQGRRVVVCPAQRKDDITCAKCQLCAKGDRATIVGFLAHGVSIKKANKIAAMVLQ